MKIGIKKEIFNDLTEINNLIKLYENNCNVKTADFRSKITSVTRPYIGDKFVPLHFELRGNNEICAIGRIEDIAEYFKLKIIDKTPSGYTFGTQKDEGGEIKRNPKSYKYFANICNYERNFIAGLKRDLNIDKDEVVYFYRTDIFVLNEKNTVNLLKNKQNYENFNKFAIHTIRRQRKLHKLFNLPYNLNIDVTLIEDSPEFKEETSLSFKIEDNDTISLVGTYEHVHNFIEPNDVNIALNIQDEGESKISSEDKWTFRNLFATTFKTNVKGLSFVQ